jgi:predicted GNAT family N-acyltransferase
MDFDLTGIRLFRLTPELIFKEFDCDDADLNDFFLNSAKHFSKQLLAVTYVLESEKDIIAFFSISNDRISLQDIKNPIQWEEFQSSFPEGKHLRSYPAIKIGRLAVNNKYKGKGYGKSIIDYLIDSFTTNNKTGCRFITVDAYKQSLSFYESTHFKYLTEKDVNKDTRLMYLDLYPYLNQ